MAIQSYKPTSPGRRGMSTQDFGEITKNEPEKSLLEHKVAQRSAATTTAASPRASAAAATSSATASIDFKRNKTGVPAKVVGIEYDPNRSARIALLQYADGEKAYILAPQQPRRRRRGRSRRTPPTSSRATAAAPLHPGRHRHPRRRAQDRPRRAARPLGRHQDHADGEGRRLGHPPHAVGRDAPRPHRLPRDGRRDRQHRARQHPVGQGRPQALARHPPAPARRVDEPGRSPDGRRRRPLAPVVATRAPRGA